MSVCVFIYSYMCTYTHHTCIPPLNHNMNYFMGKTLSLFYPDFRIIESILVIFIFFK